MRAALLEIAADCRAAAVCAHQDLNAAERQSLRALADLVERQARGERVVRRTLGTAIDRMIDLLDRIDEPDMDREPWLRAPEQQSSSWCGTFGPHDDRELEDEHGTDIDWGEDDPQDHEPLLGATEAFDQRASWRRMRGTDLEVNESAEVPTHR